MNLSNQDTFGPRRIRDCQRSVGPFGALIGLSASRRASLPPAFESVLDQSQSHSIAMYADHLQYDRRRQLANSRLRARKRNDRRPGAEHTHPPLPISRNSIPGRRTPQIDNGIIRARRPFMEKGVRSRYNGIVSWNIARPTPCILCGFRRGQDHPTRIPIVAGDIQLDWPQWSVIPVNETVDAKQWVNQRNICQLGMVSGSAPLS